MYKALDPQEIFMVFVFVNNRKNAEYHQTYHLNVV